ncbi:DEAD/DEAH box helicase [Kribbella kalugense]|uniref:DEAD/DEAH box helicase n=1 Tax=Kribbella kalugense TaxID=2512221 RepID=UPI001EE103E8|nr:DEAD/DEAH box helicase [Kribbella kalugense]
MGTEQELAGYAVVFQPADPPRTSRVAFWDPSGNPLPLGVGDQVDLDLVVNEPTESRADDHGAPEQSGASDAASRSAQSGAGDVASRSGGGPWLRTVRAIEVPVADAVPVLGRMRRAAGAHPSAAFWGGAALVALQLVARGKLLPGVSPGGHDAWRVGPLDPDDITRLLTLAEAMPPSARALPLTTPPASASTPSTTSGPTSAGPTSRGSTPPGSGSVGSTSLDPEGAAAPALSSRLSELRLPVAEDLLRDFLDAVADGMPRSPAAAKAHRTDLFAARAPQRAEGLRGWADEVSVGLDTGVRISLRIELSDSLAFSAVVQLHSLKDPTLVRDADDVWSQDVPGFGPRARIDATLAIRRAARVWAPLGQLLDQPVPNGMSWADEEVADLLAGAAQRLAAAGVELHWPRSLGRALTARAAITSPNGPPKDMPGFFGGGASLDFSWQVALGDDPLTEAELDQLAEATRPVVRLRDQWMLIDPELARKARERILKPVTAIDALGVALTGTTEIDGQQIAVTPTRWLEDLRARIADPDRADEPIEAPAELHATLRDYQLRGLRWLARMTSLGLGGCLADDMGLGKTITLISLHLHRQQSADTAGPTLVVCPASLLGNWEREIQRFAPGTSVRRFHGTSRSLDDARDGFVLTTYGTLRRDAVRLADHRWGLVVADEAQHVKNPSSGTAKALRTVPAQARVALTGTPVENNLSELWAILDWTTPGLLGRLGSFRNQWATPIEADKDEEVAARLAKLVRPFLLRRKKSDPGIAPELPPKTETDQPVSLTREQVVLYEATVRELMAEVQASDRMARRGLIVKLLTGLKQICNHPAQYLKEGADARLAGRSGKLELLDELLETIVAEDGAVLVFTQYVAMARMLERHLAERGIPTQLLHGGTPVARREEMVDRFQAGESRVFLLSLKAAGTGLNLTRADHVVHYDRWWNPAVEDQATDRAYRIGQTRPVQVHRLIAEGTIEDRIAAMLAAKRELAEAVLSGGEAALTELSDTELADLVELRGGAR